MNNTNSRIEDAIRNLEMSENERYAWLHQLVKSSDVVLDTLTGLDFNDEIDVHQRLKRSKSGRSLRWICEYASKSSAHTTANTLREAEDDLDVFVVRVNGMLLEKSKDWLEKAVLLLIFANIKKHHAQAYGTSLLRNHTLATVNLGEPPPQYVGHSWILEDILRSHETNPTVFLEHCQQLDKNRSVPWIKIPDAHYE